MNTAPTLHDESPSMNTHRLLSTLTVCAAAVLAACSSLPAGNAALDEARAAHREATATSRTQLLAPTELKQASDALARAESAQAARADAAEVTQLAYLARQRVAVAQETAARKGSEAAVGEASAERDQLRLAARTREADSARQSAAMASRDAASAQRDATASQQRAAASEQAAVASQQAVAVSQQAAAVSQQQAGEAERRSQALQAQLDELNAKKTERGMVVTLGDVLFDIGQSQLRDAGQRNIERLGGFLKQNPQRKASIEGYTDNVGSELSNQALSGRRADAVMTALLGLGVGRGQLASQGYGEARPVAGNDSAAGRQMNRRVEIVLSDDSGLLIGR